MKLNLGSGYDYKEGWINVDNGNIKKDLFWDLNDFPYPFSYESADVIEANAVIEHLPIPNQIRLVNECYRILKSGGRLIIRTAHYTSFHSWKDIEHVRPYSIHSFDSFVKDLDPRSMNDYTDRRKFSSMKAWIVFGKRIQVWNYLFEWFVNKFPDLYEQSFLSSNPAEGLRFEMIK